MQLLSTEQRLKADLERQKGLKLELTQFFGKSHFFFDNMNQPGDGHAKIYDLVKFLNRQIERAKIDFSQDKKQVERPQQVNQLNQKQPQQRGTRNRSDPRFDNEEYLAELESKMLQSLGIPPEEIGFGDLNDKRNTQKKSRTRKSGESSPNLGQLKKDLAPPNVTR